MRENKPPLNQRGPGARVKTKVKLFNGNCIEVMHSMPENSVDAVVTDPPYVLSKEPDIARVMQHWIDDSDYMHTSGGFMGKEWDSFVPGPKYWREVFRVLKPGGHVLAFGGTRTYDMMVIAIRFAGFEIRDSLQWLQGQGFPKSLDVRKAAIKAGLACECDSIPKHQVRFVREADISQAVDTEAECREVLQSVVSKQDAHASGMQRRAAIRENESLLAGRELCGTSEGLSTDSHAESPQGTQEWLRVRAHSDSGESVRATAQEVRSGSSHQSQAQRQSPEESEGLRQPQGALDGTSLPRCSKCERSIFPEGIGTALKPACEIICLARKPLEKGFTVAQNVQKWGTGGLNIDGCRIDSILLPSDKRMSKGAIPKGTVNYGGGMPVGGHSESVRHNPQGRFPANVILDETAGEMLDLQAPSTGAQAPVKRKTTPQTTNLENFKPHTSVGDDGASFKGDSGGASRFFYRAKASTSERNAGLEGMPKGILATSTGQTRPNQPARLGADPHAVQKPVANTHPTVKPVKLMEYLCRLVTPPGGIVLDPFMGSGTTGIAAQNEGFGFVGIEMNEEYFKIAERRCRN